MPQQNLCWVNFIAPQPGTPVDKAEAARWYQKASDLAFVNAQNELGRAYLHGEEWKKNDERAVELFKKAAEKGYAPAQSELGFAYYFGEGLQR